jgi:hypothetical protein
MSESFTVTAELGAKTHKIFQILFNSKSGAIFVSMPYFSEKEGLLASAELGSGVVTETLDLGDKGALVSHGVKYSHPPDGNAHFSQDRKIYSKIRRQSMPLARLNGHMFTLMFNDISRFEIAKEKDWRALPEKRAWLKLPVNAEASATIKVVGRWYSRSNFQRRFRPLASKSRIGPVFHFDQNGQERYLEAIAPPRNHPASGSILVIETVPVRDFAGPADPFLLFVGGFDQTASMKEPLGFLAALYPASDFQALSRILPSVDFSPSE